MRTISLSKAFLSATVFSAVLSGVVGVRSAVAVGPDQLGYTSITSAEAGGPVFQFVDISETGTRLTFIDPDPPGSGSTRPDDDGVAININLTGLNGGKGFPFYGQLNPIVHMSTNGFLHFELNPSSDAFSNNCPLANIAQPNNLVAVLWDDFEFPEPAVATSGGFAQVFSVCPSTQGGTGACAVFLWKNTRRFGGTDMRFSFEAILYENGNILMNYGPGNPQAGGGSTTGIENSTGTIGSTQACNAASSIPDNSSILFRAPAGLAAEREANDSSSIASLLSNGFCGAGSISTNTDRDFWFTPFVDAGDLVFTAVETQISTPSKDSRLQVLASDGATVLAADDDSGLPAGGSSGSAVAGIPVTQTGNLFMKIEEKGNDALLAPYLVQSAVVKPSNTQSEVEPNNEPATATPITASLVTGASIGLAELDYYSVVAKAGDRLTVIVDEDPRKLGVKADTIVDIVAPNGATVISAGDNAVGNATNIAGPVFAPIDGTYYIKIRVDTSLSVGTEYRFIALKNCKEVCNDQDGDARCDLDDNCLTVANPDQLNTDGDALGDACELCPTDAAKTAPGGCGCGIADVDADGSGILDCQFGGELKKRIADLTTLVRRLNPSSKPKRKRNIRRALVGLEEYMAKVQVSISGGAEVEAQRASAQLAIRKTLRATATNFRARKRKSLAELNKLIETLG